MNENGNSTIIEEKKGKGKKRVKKAKNIESTAARLVEEDQVLEMEVGQDSEFLSEDLSDDESNVIVFKDQEKGNNDAEGSCDEDMEDDELQEILEKNYQIAGLDKGPAEKFSDKSGHKSIESQKEQIIGEAMDKFKETFLRSGFIETTNKLQKQLLESQQKCWSNQGKLKGCTSRVI